MVGIINSSLKSIIMAKLQAIRDMYLDGEITPQVAMRRYHLSVAQFWNLVK